MITVPWQLLKFFSDNQLERLCYSTLCYSLHDVQVKNEHILDVGCVCLILNSTQILVRVISRSLSGMNCSFRNNGVEMTGFRCACVYRRTPLWLWTQTVMPMRRGLMRAGTGRTDPLPTARMKMLRCTVTLCEPSLPPALPLALGLARAQGAALAQCWTVPLSRRLVRGPAPCPPPAPGPSHTMIGLMIRLSAQWSASTQECRETKVFPLLDTGTL